MKRKVPSPCVDVCKYALKGHCIGCGMTKKQKKSFKKLKGTKTKFKFLQALLEQQRSIKLKANWERSYRRRCAKKRMDCPLDLVRSPTA